MNNFIYILLLPLLLVSCSDSTIVFQENKEIESNTWNKDENVSFDFDIDDTTEFYDFYINLRTTTSYEWSNIYLFVEIQFPNKQYNIDTVEFVLANPLGEWTGVSSGSIVNNNIQFINKRRFPQLGTYTLSFTQAMRQDDLNEIMDVGLVMKKSPVKHE